MDDCDARFADERADDLPVDETEGLAIPTDPEPRTPTPEERRHADDEAVDGATPTDGSGGGTRFFGAEAPGNGA